MEKLIILGSGSAVANEEHENTYLALQAGSQTVMIDCVGHPLLRFQRVGLDFQQVSDLILTHYHPDHVSGVPLFLMDMWLLGRSQPLTIHGLAHTLDRVEATMNSYDWQEWSGLYPVLFHRLEQAEMTPVLDSPNLQIFASPVKHLLPTIGLRILLKLAGAIIAYSADTEPCPQVVTLANRTDLLIHEATGHFPGHSSAAQAGQVANQAKARKLCLIHYHAAHQDESAMIQQAKQAFQGEVIVAQDYLSFEL